MVGWHHQLDGPGFGWTPGVGGGQGGLEWASRNFRALRNSHSSCQYFYNITKLYITDKHIYKHGAAATAAKSRQLCLILCDPIDSSPLDSPGPGILQARTLEWVAIA